MKIEIHHHYHFKSLDDVAESLGVILRKLNSMSAELDRLTKEVEENGTAVDSLITLVTGLADEIRRLKDDPAKLAKLADELDAKQAAIAAAVTANTPDAPTE